ncbi:response regulator transcription factor [Thermovibrio sp.]
MEICVFVKLYNRILEVSLVNFLQKLKVETALKPESSSVAVVDKVSLLELPYSNLSAQGVKFLLIDLGEDEEELHFLVKNYPISGVIYPEMEPELLKKCISTVAKGEKWFKRDFLVSLSKEGISVSTFSEREVEVIGLLIKGKTNKEIARALGLTEQTVKYYINQLLKKTGLSNRVELVKLFSKVYKYVKR